jgi:pimeloyl-ACP methyl ester carboxylesterase
MLRKLCNSTCCFRTDSKPWGTFLRNHNPVALPPGRASLVAALRMAGLRNVFVTDWRSASPEMRFFSIDSYLAVGGCANLIGVCQGGWMALVYAARYPSKIRGLVLAGAPVDINAGESELSRVAHSVPTSAFKQLVELGDGRVRGSHLMQFWKHPSLEPEAIHGLLQVPADIATPRSSRLITLFREWHARPIDISPAPIISRSFNGSIKTINLQLAVSQRSDARLISQ